MRLVNRLYFLPGKHIDEMAGEYRPNFRVCVILIKIKRRSSGMEINEDRSVFIANEIGAAVIELIAHDMDVNRANIAGTLEGKRKVAGNTLYKGVLRDAAALVRETK